MNTRYQITEVATGRSAIKEDELDGGLCDFDWTEGNMSCDCNRKLEFIRAGGDGAPREPNHGEIQCGSGGYRLDWVEVNGTRIIENDKATEHADCRENG